MQILELTIKIMRHWLPICTTCAICIVEEKRLNHVPVLHCQLRAHDVLLNLLAELLKSPAMVKFYFKFYLLRARILRIGIGVLVGDALLLQVLILDFNSHKELDATLVFLLVAWDKGWLLARRIRTASGRLTCGLLAIRVIDCRLGC